MIWWMCFFATAAASSLKGSRGTLGWSQLSMDMYTIPKTVYGGDSFDLFCSYNASFVTPKHYLYFEEGDLLNSVAVDNHTLMYRTLKTPEEGALLFFYCEIDDHRMSIELIVIPKMNIKDFECISKGEELEVECSFGRLGNMVIWDNIKYHLTIDNGEKDKCWGIGNRIGCAAKYSNATTENLNHTFTLEMDCNREVQKQIFYLSRSQMKVPPWSDRHNIISTKRGILTCMVSRFDYELSYDYKVRLQLKNPRIMEIIVKPIKQMDGVCFLTPRFNNQTIEVRVWRRYEGEDTPWTRNYYAYIIQTESFPPERPPKITPGVFFYDPEKKDLHIFWKELEELELNRLDYTYTVQTSSGEKAIDKTNSSAVFHQWDPTKSATVLVWNQNSVGRSENTSKLEVPVLTNSLLHQPQDLWYHFENQSMTWKPPQDENKLISYIVIWCSVSSNSTFLCEDQKPLHLESVPESIQNYQFNTQAADLNKAVVALYENEKSGGMVWIGPSFPDTKKTMSNTSVVEKTIYIIGSLAILFIPIIIVLLRKLKKMSEIDIVFPVGLLDPVDMTNRFVNPPDPIAIPGSVSPRAIVNIEMMLMKNIPEEELHTTSNGYVKIRGRSNFGINSSYVTADKIGAGNQNYSSNY